jgi:hypothetical protein
MPETLAELRPASHALVTVPKGGDRASLGIRAAERVKSIGIKDRGTSLRNALTCLSLAHNMGAPKD